MNNCGMTSGLVNYYLEQFNIAAATASGTSLIRVIQMSGNSAPSGAGLDYKASLISKGFSVTTA
jgi:hypothetical protein